MNKLYTIILLLLFIAVSGSPEIRAASMKYQEKEVKVAFLYRTLQYVKWEHILSDPAESIKLCALADADFKTLLLSLEKRMVANRKVEIISDYSLDNVQKCNVLYLHSTSSRQFRANINAVGNSSILTINDNPRFVHKGAIVNFVFRNQRIAIEVNIKQAEKQKIMFSAKFLRIVTIIGNGN